MKNNYTSFQNINKTASGIKQFFIASIIIASVFFNNSYGQVTIAVPALTITTCAFPSADIALGNIVISEVYGNDISTYGDLILSAPPNFEFQASTATVTYTAARNINSATITTTPTTITLTITGSGAPAIDMITISSIKLKALNSASGPSNVARTGGTSVIAGDVTGTVHATVTSVLNSINGGTIAGAQTICKNGNPLAFTETFAATGSGTLIYDWKSSTDGYNGTLSTNAIYDVPAGLNTTTTYRRIAKSSYNGTTCTANSNDLIVTVNDISGGLLSSPQTICSGGNPAPFTETTFASGTGVVSYDWRYSTNNYSSTIAGSATYDVPAGLTDTTTYRRIATSTLNLVSCTANSNDLTISVISVIGGAVSSPQTICNGGTDPNMLTGVAPSGGDGTYTYLWESSIINATTGFTAATNTNTASDYYPNSLTDTTWYRRKVSSMGCSSSDTAAIEITVNPIPLLTSVLFDTACSGSPFNYNPTSQVIGASFVWSRAVQTGISNAAASGTNSPNETLINTTASPAFVYYLYTVSANSCTNATPASLAVTVKTRPVLDPQAATVICSNTIFIYAPTSSTTGASFTWTRAAIAGISNPAASGSDAISETLINTTTAPIIVTYVYTTSANGCSSNENVTVTVNPKPSLNSSLSEIICSDVLFNYTPTSLTTGATFTWTRAAVAGISNPLGSGADDPNEQLFNTTTSPINVSYVYTTLANGCDSAETLIVTVKPAPSVTNVSNDTSCSGADPSITLTANMPSTFAWTLGENPDGITGGSDSSGPTLNQILTNPSNSTTFSLQYNVTATSGTCSGNSSAVYINVNPAPLASAGGNSTICSDSSVIIGGSPTASAGNGPYTYTWTPVADLDNAAVSNPTANPSVNTTYSVTVTDSLGCAASVSTMMVTVNTAPNVSAGADTTICIGHTATLLASGGSSYIWSTGSSANAITVNPTVNTTYNVKGITNGCAHYDTVLVTVDSIPAVNAGSDITICAGQMATLTATGGNSYLWSTGSQGNIITDSPPASTDYFVTGTTNGCSVKDTVHVTVNTLPIVNGGSDTIICAGQSIILSGSGNGSPYTWDNGVTDGTGFTPTTTAIYNVTATMNGCSQIDSVQVTVNSLPIVNAGTDTTICETQSIILTASGASSYLWSTGASVNPITQMPTTTTTYYVTGIDVNNCSANDTVIIAVNPAPLAIAGTDFTICIGDTVTLAGSGGISYVWTDGGTSFNTPTVLVNPVATTQYALTVTDNSGCMASDTAMVYVTPSKDISGNVYYSLGPVTNGMAVLYKYEQSQTRFDSIQYVPLNPSSGEYIFNNVNYGQYLVKVFADSTSYPTLINTYYGDEFLWNGDSVRVINHSCNANTTLDSVTMVELTGTGGGIGLIIGKITEGVSFGRAFGEPIPGVDIKLGKNPGGSIVATTNTDSSGLFTFSGVADGNYTIYVDIPGLARDSSYTFTVDSTNNQFLNQNYIADSNAVFINPTTTVGISNPVTASENKFSVYPNPVKGNTTIEYSIPQMVDSKTTLELTTVLGVKINTLVNATQLAGTYKYNFNPQNYHLNSGVYFITLTINGKADTKRIVVID